MNMTARSLWMVTALLMPGALWAKPPECGNLTSTMYNRTPRHFSPDGTRGIGVTVWIKGTLSAIPDTRPECLPIPLRYNNLGALKTRAAGFWSGQIAKDDKGHAVFASTAEGMAAWGTWIKTKHDSGKPVTATSLMSIYAPPTDCIGSLVIYPNCVIGPNPTREYAARVAASVGKRPDDRLNIDGTDCKEGRAALYALFREIASFEIGGNFCGREDRRSRPLCGIDSNMFDTAMDKSFGPVHHGPCADPPLPH